MRAFDGFIDSQEIMNLTDIGTPYILIVDDEPWINEALKESLEDAGHKVVTTTSSSAALDICRVREPQAVILDLGLPGLSGLDLLKELRVSLNIPIMILSGRKDESIKVEAFRLGADDYVCKPFGPAELVARVGALLRRAQSSPRTTRLKFADIELDLAERRAWRSGRELSLTKKEFQILQCLVEKPGEVMTPELILTRAWGPDFIHYQRTVKVHIGNLRKKLGPRDYIRTVVGFGYSLVDPGDSGNETSALQAQTNDG